MKRPAFPAPLRLFVVLFTPTLLAGCGVTSTYGTGQSPEMALFREMTGGLLSKEEKEPIDYQARAPLVLPPATGQLPTPAESAAAANPDWPVDPNERILSADARAGDDDPYNDVNQAEYRRLRPLAGVFPEQSRTVSNDESGKDEYYNNIVHGRHQREEFRQALADTKGYGRSERRFLTDPPLDYREPVPTAPTGEEALLPKKKKGNFLTRWWRGS